MPLLLEPPLALVKVLNAVVEIARTHAIKDGNLRLAEVVEFAPAERTAGVAGAEPAVDAGLVEDVGAGESAEGGRPVQVFEAQVAVGGTLVVVFYTLITSISVELEGRYGVVFFIGG